MPARQSLQLTALQQAQALVPSTTRMKRMRRLRQAKRPSLLVSCRHFLNNSINANYCCLGLDISHTPCKLERQYWPRLLRQEQLLLWRLPHRWQPLVCGHFSTTVALQSLGIMQTVAASQATTMTLTWIELAMPSVGKSYLFYICTFVFAHWGFGMRH